MLYPEAVLGPKTVDFGHCPNLKISMCFKSCLIYLQQESTTNFNCLAIALWMPDRSASIAHIWACTQYCEASRTDLRAWGAMSKQRGFVAQIYT